MTQKRFKELLGGRINYSNVQRYCKTLKHNMILFTEMEKYRAKGKTLWESAKKAREVLRKNNIHSGTSVYVNHLISRYYKIRKAIKDTQQEIDFKILNN